MNIQACLVILGFSCLLSVSCSSDEGTTQTSPPIVQSPSLDSARFTNITSYSDNGYTNVQFGAITNNNFAGKLNVSGYNSNYTYAIKIKGEQLNNEYQANLTFDEINDSNDTILKFDKSDFDAVPDVYQAYIVENESNTEVKINNAKDKSTWPYKIYDADHAKFLYALIFKPGVDDFSSIVSTISTSSSSVVINYPSVGNFSGGLDLEMAVFDSNLNLLGKVDVSSTGGSGYNKVFKGTDMTFVTSSGDYIFQLQGTPQANSGKTYRESNYVKLNVTTTP